MVRSAAHTFHTRHDFTPELGWAAFQLVYEIGRAGADSAALEDAARAATSPLARRSDLTKVLASLEDLDLLARDGKAVALTDFGQALAAGVGAYETGFRAAVHCIYAWQWLWEGDREHASPSWSYREVCRHLLSSPPAGIASDDLVLRVVDAASLFNAQRVSFSRSSVSGVVNWLMAQTPPLVEQVGKNVARVRGQAPSSTSLRLNLAAACALKGGRVSLDGDALNLLAESVLIPPDELWLPVVEYARDSVEFKFIPGGRGTVVFDHGEDAFVRWVSNAAGRRG
jgi:hypothetical protein